MLHHRNQKGFTIIELVVVILLLGILTATALPRFMEITDEAHQAVVDGLEGGLQTGVALFHAQWVAEGSPIGAAVGFGDGTLYANAAGYPIGADGSFNSADDCLAIYQGLMQQGGLPEGYAQVGYDVNTENAVELAAAGITGSDTATIIALANDDTTPTGCGFYYVGQYRIGTTASPHTIQSLIYDSAAGTITQGTLALDDG